MTDRDTLRLSVGLLLAVNAWIVTHAITHPSVSMTEFAVFATTVSALIIYTFRHHIRGSRGKK